MSRWVNGSLEDLLLVSVSQRPSRVSQIIRAEHELGSWRGEGAPPPDHSAADLDFFLDELADDRLDLALRSLVVDSIGAMLPPEEPTAVFFAHAASVAELRDALEEVCSRVSDRRLSRLISPHEPLGACVKGLLARASAVTRALERFGFGSLHAAEREAFAREVRAAAELPLGELRGAVRRELAAAGLELGTGSVALKALREAVERLFAAGERLDALRAA